MNDVFVIYQSEKMLSKVLTVRKANVRVGKLNGNVFSVVNDNFW